MLSLNAQRHLFAWHGPQAGLDVPSWMRVQIVIRKLQGVTPAGLATSFMEIDHEIFATVILSLLLIQEGQLSVSGETNVHKTG